MTDRLTLTFKEEEEGEENEEEKEEEEGEKEKKGEGGRGKEKEEGKAWGMKITASPTMSNYRTGWRASRQGNVQGDGEPRAQGLVGRPGSSQHVSSFSKIFHKVGYLIKKVLSFFFNALFQFSFYVGQWRV